ncbi:unnamed protein product [Closterium sp. NIES-65]|nr:unnamed protein product [Closterium sp. NIES-65]
MGDKGATRGFITTIAQGLPGKWFLVVSTASLSSGAISPSFLSWNEFQEWWWPQQHQIVAVGYGCNVWRAAYASHVFALQTCNFFSSFDAASKYIVRQSEQGLRVTALAQGAGQWFVVMSKGGAMPALSQGLVCSTSLADFIRTFQRGFEEHDRVPTCLVYGDGRWVGVWSAVREGVVAGAGTSGGSSSVSSGGSSLTSLHHNSSSSTSSGSSITSVFGSMGFGSGSASTSSGNSGNGHVHGSSITPTPHVVTSSNTSSSSSSSGGGGGGSGVGGSAGQQSRALKFVVVKQSSDNALVLNALEDSYSILAVASSPTATLVALIKPALYRSQVAYHCDGSGSSNGWIVNNISDRTPCWYSQLTLDSPAHRQEFALHRTVLASSSAALFRRPTPPAPSAQTPSLGTVE